MGNISLDLPTIGQPNTTEDVKIRNNFTTLQNVINGNIDATNLSPGILSQLGNFKSALSAVQVQDVGNANQIRAGRVLTPNDFTNMGLTTPTGIWNLGTVNDSSGNARNLTNKGSVTFDTGIMGAAAEASVFTGSTGQALYLADTGAADPFRIRTGSWGCWINCSKRGTQQYVFTKINTSGSSTTQWFTTAITTGNVIQAAWGGAQLAVGTTDVCDSKWHWVVATLDGTMLRLYVDGALEGAVFQTNVPVVTTAGPLNIGGYGADGATATNSPYFGKVDEAFVTQDVLSPDQILNLYCASIPHTLGTVPSGTRLAIRRRKRGGLLTVANFPATPIRLHNFTAGSLTDEGSGAVGLTSNPGTGLIVSTSGADGDLGDGYTFAGAHNGLSATDTGLPSGTSARSYGCWFKSASVSQQGIVGWGTINTADAKLRLNGSGILVADSGADVATGIFAADGGWHHAVEVEDNAATDGLKRKLYLDGRVIASSTVLTSLTLAGANRYRIGAAPDGTLPLIGQTDGAFVYAGALTDAQVRTLYNIGSQQFPLSPKVDADHIETLELTRVLARFDLVEGTDLVDLAVIA